MWIIIVISVSLSLLRRRKGSGNTLCISQTYWNEINRMFHDPWLYLILNYCKSAGIFRLLLLECQFTLTYLFKSIRRAYLSFFCEKFELWISFNSCKIRKVAAFTMNCLKMCYNSHKIVGMVSNKGQIMDELAAATPKSMYY